MSKVEEERKIVASTLGFIVATLFSLIALLCIVSGLFITYLFHTGGLPESTDLVSYQRPGIIVDNLPSLHNDSDPLLFYTGMTCFLLGCLSYLYFLLRAMIQPSFLAGKPDIKKFIPLCFPPLLRIIFDLVLFIMTREFYFFAMIVWLWFCLIFSGVFYLVYHVDDDNPRKDQYGDEIMNLKPWQYERIIVPTSSYTSKSLLLHDFDYELNLMFPV